MWQFIFFFATSILFSWYASEILLWFILSTNMYVTYVLDVFYRCNSIFWMHTSASWRSASKWGPLIYLHFLQFFILLLVCLFIILNFFYQKAEIADYLIKKGTTAPRTKLVPFSALGIKMLSIWLKLTSGKRFSQRLVPGFSVDEKFYQTLWQINKKHIRSNNLFK